MFAEKELVNQSRTLSHKKQKDCSEPSCNYDGTIYLRPNQPCFFLNDSNTSVFQRKTQSNSTGLPDQLKTNIESVSGYCLDDVKVHYNSSKPAFFHALAYTQGTEIHVAPGEERHLPHEAWHVVQQKQGRVQPVAKLKGQPFNDSTALEQEADTMGIKISQLNAGVAQMKLKTAFQGAVIQRVSHIATKDDIDYDHLPTLLANPKPTIVFETMGLAQENADSIYNQAKNYTGNTICVFGLNKRDDSLRSPLHKLEDKTDPPHCLRNFSFLWKRPTAIDRNAQYETPFIEARRAVMKKAQLLVDCILGLLDEPQESLENDKKEQIIYRWIDGDVQNDTSEQINAEFLTEFAEDSNARLATGTYDWRHAAPATTLSSPFYHQFIDTINQAEHELRKKFYELIDKTEARLSKLRGEYYIEAMKLRWDKKFSENYGSEAQLQQLLRALEGFRSLELSFRKDGYLPGFYLPEPTLLMNQKAHTKILGAYEQEQFGEGAQDKESMKMAEKTEIDPRDISFIDELRVSKPLKHEFSTSEEHLSYIFNIKMKQLFSQNYLIDNLRNAMGSFRQSAFDPTKWNLAGNPLDQEFSEFREQKIMELDVFLKAQPQQQQQQQNKTNFQLIQEELARIDRDLIT